MHEMALTRNVVDIVIAEAEKVHAKSVHAVHVTVGEVRDIIDDIFVDMFGWLARGTIAEHAEVHLTRVPLMVKCNQCGNVYHINTRDESTWPCEKCGVRDYKLQSGMEFFISNIEVEFDNKPLTEEDLKAAMARVAAVNRANAEAAAREEEQERQLAEAAAAAQASAEAEEAAQA